jgi:NAD(P)H-hydrate repair Nnr-like enzyme with NAD(P)H-hydrate epimerase domain
MLQARDVILRPHYGRIKSYPYSLSWKSISSTVNEKYLPSPGPYIPPMKTHYKTIIVGGGHNGLVAAAYLAKSGIATSFYHLHCEKNCYSFRRQNFEAVVFEYRSAAVVVQ